MRYGVHDGSDILSLIPHSVLLYYRLLILVEMIYMFDVILLLYSYYSLVRVCLCA